MEKTKKFIIGLILPVFVLLSGCMTETAPEGQINEAPEAETVQTEAEIVQAEAETIQAETETTKNVLVGLLSDGGWGSSIMYYDIGAEEVSTVMKLPEVTSDNYVAISPDGRYIAYTTWEPKTYARRYLCVLDTETGETQEYLRDLYKTQVKNISWIDSERIVYVLSDQNEFIYQEIQCLNALTGEIEVLVEGGLWKMRASFDEGEEETDHVIQHSGETVPVKWHDEENIAGNEVVWSYYYTQEELNEIYQKYGGTGEYDIYDVNNYFAIKFSAPKISPNGRYLVYSAVLDRNSASGEHRTLWMIASIWLYDLETGENRIVYTPDDGASLGRVDWISDKELVFVSYYEFQGSADDINYLNLDTAEKRILFEHRDDAYNNVTLLRAGGRDIFFTTSARYETYEESTLVCLNADTGEYEALEINVGGEALLPEGFIYEEISEKST